MIQSSNIRIMSSALLKIAKILRRDFSELEKIQNSKQNVEKFVFKSIENIKDSINIDLIKARPEAKLFFVEDGSEIQQEDFFFLVDPVSGVKNFSHGISYFASSIALIIDSKVIAAIIYDPIRDEMFYAEKGKGAYLNNSRIRVSSNNKINRAILVLESIDLINFINIQDEVAGSVRVLGSSSLDLANTANGKIDCYFSKNLNFQSSTAGLFLVREAGGILHQDKDNRYSMVTNNGMNANL